MISVLCVFVFSLFLSISDCLADEFGGELNNDISNEAKPNNIKNNNNDKTSIPNASNEDIFGDAQAFPFIAGLGKNAAHYFTSMFFSLFPLRH